MWPTVNTDNDIRLEAHVKVERPETLTVARGSFPLVWGQEISRKRRSSYSILAMARKAVMGEAPDGYWHCSHAMDELGSLREENAERNIC